MLKLLLYPMHKRHGHLADAGVANQTLPNAHLKVKLLQSLCQLTHRCM